MIKGILWAIGIIFAVGVIEASFFLLPLFIRSILTWFDNMRYRRNYNKANKCKCCNGRGRFYPASNVGGSCRVPCTECEGTGLQKE